MYQLSLAGIPCCQDDQACGEGPEYILNARKKKKIISSIMEARNRIEPDGLGHFLTLGSFLCNEFRRTEEEFHFTIVLGNPGRLLERRNN